MNTKNVTGETIKFELTDSAIILVILKIYSSSTMLKWMMSFVVRVSCSNNSKNHMDDSKHRTE